MRPTGCLCLRSARDRSTISGRIRWRCGAYGGEPALKATAAPIPLGTRFSILTRSPRPRVPTGSIRARTVWPPKSGSVWFLCPTVARMRSRCASSTPRPRALLPVVSTCQRANNRPLGLIRTPCWSAANGRRAMSPSLAIPTSSSVSNAAKPCQRRPRSFREPRPMLASGRGLFAMQKVAMWLTISPARSASLTANITS